MVFLKLILSLCFFLFLIPVDGKWDDLVVTWDQSGYAARANSTGFFSIPTTAEEAKCAGWEKIESDSEYWDIWCYDNDPRVCILTDQQGNFAGMDVGIPAADFKGPYDVSLHPIYTNITRFNTLIQKIRFFVVSQVELENGGRKNMSEGLGSGVWLQEGNKLIEVPITESEIQSKTSYVEENCIPGMGKHYYYNVTPSLDCMYFEPVFLTLDNETREIHGIGIQAVGVRSKGNKMYFEDIPTAYIKPTVPTAPDCLMDWATQYGIISFHVYFRSSPWNITC